MEYDKDMKSPTTLKVRKGTRDRLARLCKKDDTFDKIITMLLEQHEFQLGEQVQQWLKTLTFFVNIVTDW